ncbi:MULTISPECIES: hypothetical protein [unclassified Pseudoalteromonas]|uniref:hypothetical protein n=1 Tax=unclassified Pseudoalteromonas TaxID=194690 RepID=UPI0025B4D92C|nr:MULTISPECIES: hypothetical protein [unclassified Pseudoalteromonas]MDN3388242.1 hypothetical protein [Pseudoalteromonas sp. APC 4017]
MKPICAGLTKLMQNSPSEPLISLYEKTHQLLRLYNDKEQWPHTYPLLNQLAEQFYLLYKTNPNALQAQLSLYVESYGYTTNLVVTQCTLIAVFCKSLSYNTQVSQLLLAVCLTNYLCVQVQTNKLAKQHTLNPQEKKQWQARHQLAIKLLQSAKVATPNIARILAPLNKYKQALLSTPKIMIYDGATTLVALANIIAMNITYRAANDHVSLYKAVADIYVRTPNSFAQHALKSLISEIGPYLPGSIAIFSDQQLIYVGKISKNKILIVNLNDEKRVRWHAISGKISCQDKQRPTKDKRLIYGIWFNEHLAAPINTSVHTQQQIILLISQLKIQHEYSYHAIEKLLKNQTNTINNLREAVKPYNKEHLAGKDLRHCLSMVGIDNAPAIIQRVLFQQLVQTHHHPLQEHIRIRTDAIIKILALLVSKDTSLQFEQLTLPVYAYVAYLFDYCSNALSRKILSDDEAKSDISRPLAWLFGVENHDSEQLSISLLNLVGDNPWTQPLLDAEQNKKQKLSVESQLWVCVKLLILNVFRPEVPLSSWQNQTINSVLKNLGWQSSQHFYAHLPDLNLSSSV